MSDTNTKKIDVSRLPCPSFRGELGFLSNMYTTPLFTNNTWFYSAEAAYQYFKTTDKSVRYMLSKLNGSQAKRFFKDNSAYIRPDWFDIRDKVMLAVLFKKFTQNPNLQQLLIDVDPKKLIEVNYWHDTYWGVCVCKRCNGNGKNVLGQQLAAVQEALKQTNTTIHPSPLEPL